VPDHSGRVFVLLVPAALIAFAPLSAEAPARRLGGAR